MDLKKAFSLNACKWVVYEYWGDILRVRLNKMKRNHEMREVQYKKKVSPQNNRKMMSISEHSEDKDCKTHVRKSFVYVVSRAARMEKEQPAPDISIKKLRDTKKQQEQFSFRVKGHFYMVQGRGVCRVDFCHSLRIDIDWKNKISPPKKSETLT